jgi:hypothetical protein
MMEITGVNCLLYMGEQNRQFTVWWSGEDRCLLWLLKCGAKRPDLALTIGNMLSRTLPETAMVADSGELLQD